MSKPPFRALRVVLGFLSLIMAIGGVLLIFSSKPLIERVSLHPPEAEISTLLLATLKGDGWVGAHARRHALLCRPRPAAQRGDYRRPHGGSLHIGRYAARISLHARPGQTLSGLCDLGPILDEARAGGFALFSEAEGEGLETCGEFLKREETGQEFCVLREKAASGPYISKTAAPHFACTVTEMNRLVIAELPMRLRPHTAAPGRSDPLARWQGLHEYETRRVPSAR
jgi:hypothetical protein